MIYKTIPVGQTFPFQPRAKRATLDDFDATSGSVVFADGQKTAAFTIRIKADALPEADESIFAILQTAELIRDTQAEIGEYIRCSVSCPAIVALRQSVGLGIVRDRGFETRLCHLVFPLGKETNRHC